MKKQKLWLDERCQTAGIEDPSEINGDNLNNIRCETSRHFRNKKREYLKDKIDELATNSKNKNMLLSRNKNAGQNYDIKTANRSFKMRHSSNIWERL
jgi:hypothetical protein